MSDDLLRDLFAGLAVAGDLAASGSSAGTWDPKIGAKWAYDMADAMMAERARRNASDPEKPF